MLMSWWHKLFAPKEPTYRDVEVGRIDRAVVGQLAQGAQNGLRIGHVVDVDDLNRAGSRDAVRRPESRQVGRCGNGVDVFAE